MTLDELQKKHNKRMKRGNKNWVFVMPEKSIIGSCLSGGIMTIGYKKTARCGKMKGAI